MQKLLIATKNPGKLAEFSEFLSDLPVEIISLTNVGINENVEEDGKTYEENSKKKALFFAKKSGLPTIADDGGLEIAALDGAPGVKSRRWLGYEATDEALIAYMKKVARKLPKNNRRARFKTVVSFALPNGRVFNVEEDVAGVIAEEPIKHLLHGYPYRSFFYLPKIKKFYHESQLSAQEMREYNHRYKAIQKLKPIIQHVILSEAKESH